MIKVKLKNGWTGQLVKDVHVLFNNYDNDSYTVPIDHIANISTEIDRDKYCELLRICKLLRKNNKKLLNKVRNLRKLLRRKNKLNGDVTNKYKNMIEAFECDFGVATDHNDFRILRGLPGLIKNRDERIMKDIELLEELSFGLRHGYLKIYDVREEKKNDK